MSRHSARLKKDLQAASRELERARTLARMIAGFVHQFRTPLHIITSTGENLAVAKKMPTELKPELELLRRSANRLNASVSQLLSFARGDAVPWTETSINDPLNKVIDFLKEESQKRGITLDLKQEVKLPPVRMQQALLEEAFLNFAMNGIDAMSKGGVLSLHSQMAPDGKRVCVRIQDTGHGMDARMLKRLGQAFSTSKKDGMGLGVYFACEILKAHNVIPHVESRISEGTRITLAFPT